MRVTWSGPGPALTRSLTIINLDLAMSKRAKISHLKIKSSDGKEFIVDEELVNEMETLKEMTMFGDDDDQVPTCALNGTSLKEVLVFTEYQKKLKNMDLRGTFNMIISADYLANETLLEKLLKKVFLKNSFKDIDEAAS